MAVSLLEQEVGRLSLEPGGPSLAAVLAMAFPCRSLQPPGACDLAFVAEAFAIKYSVPLPRP